MSLPLSLWIGIRFSRAGRPSAIMSPMSWISTIGIVIGVTVLIVGISAMNGFEYELKNRILSIVPHGQIEKDRKLWNCWQDAIIKIEKVPGIVAAGPYISFTGLVESVSSMRPIHLKGVNPKKEERLSSLSKFIQKKVWEGFRAGEQQIIIGKGLADNLKVRTGDWVSVMIYNNNLTANHNLKEPKRIRLRISGIFQISNQFDHVFAIVPLEDAQDYLEIGNSVIGIGIKFKDVFNAHFLVRNVSVAIDDSVHVKSWIETYGYMYRDIQMIRSIIYLAMILVIGVACFNIITILITAVQDKKTEIAVLSTLGLKNAGIRAIFIWYGIIIGLLGGFFGIVIGILLSLNLTNLIKGIEKYIGHHFLSSNIYFIDFLPSKLNWLDVISVFLLTLFLSLLGSWYPAKRAIRIDPSKTLSNQ